MRWGVCLREVVEEVVCWGCACASGRVTVKGLLRLFWREKCYRGRECFMGLYIRIAARSVEEEFYIRKLM